MTVTIRFTVLGVPIQQGSARAFVRNGRAVITSDTRRDLKAWRQDIARAARHAGGGRTLPRDVPVTVRLAFRMPPPRKLPRGRVAPTTTPDLDKLQRASFDALQTAGLVTNDSQIVDAHAVKLYATPAHPPGMYAEVEFHEPEVLL